MGFYPTNLLCKVQDDSTVVVYRFSLYFPPSLTFTPLPLWEKASTEYLNKKIEPVSVLLKNNYL